MDNPTILPQPIYDTNRFNGLENDILQASLLILFRSIFFASVLPQHISMYICSHLMMKARKYTKL
jgi:hypothetical protein